MTAAMSRKDPGVRDKDEFGGLWDLVGRLLCRLGVHDFRVVEGTFGFGDAGNIERLECRRCGHVTTRQV